MKAKLLLQDLCRKKLGWDTAIAEQDRIQWFHLLEDVPKLENLQVDRCFKPKNFAQIKNAQLHIFSDGSRVGYGAVAYLRLDDVFDRVLCTFVMEKSQSVSCVLRSPSVAQVRVFIFGNSTLNFGEIIKSSLDFDISCYANSELFICKAVCYKRLLKFERATEKVLELKREILESFQGRLWSPGNQ